MKNYSFFLRLLCIILWMLILSVMVHAQLVRQVRLSHFTLQSSAVISAGGDSISSPSYSPNNYWFPVQVPCTVLSGLVQNHVYPDPYLGMNNMLIPDASDSFNHQYQLEKYSHLPNDPNPWKKPYWYRTLFTIPAGDQGKFFQLIFKGINYRAEVWLNGWKIADSSVMVGMFAEYSFDVTKNIKPGAENALAVKIFPLDVPGLPAHPQLTALGDFYENGGVTGDIGKNVTMLSSIGWDWIPEVRDRNMGIWQPVYLRSNGPVTIGQAQVITDLPNFPDTSVANISLRLNLSNRSDRTQQGTIKVSLSPENFHGQPISFNEPQSIAAGESKLISLNPGNHKELLIHQPALWWPNGYGYPNLYRIRLQWVSGTQVTEDTSFLAGIRIIGSSATDVNGWKRRDFYVNGKKVHLVGGAWVPDMMLNRDSLRYDYELRLCRNANANLVRIWGGGLAETDDFYELADRYGLMVWQDFWITGDTHGEFKGSPDWPLEGEVFKKNIISTIYRIRNHPSLLVWTGGNEGHAREELYNAMRDNVANLDGTRPFIPSSSGFAKQAKGWKGSWPDDQPAGVYSGGPYSWVEASQYYRLVDNGRDWVFKDETGLPSQPPYNSLPKIISNLEPDKTLPYPLNNTWGYHDACTGNGHYELYYKAMVNRYGEPTGMKDFSDKMQLLNADSYRGIFEAVGHKLNQTGGVMLWKLNAAFPSVVWQVYDWFLQPNSGYYFMQRACEPLHIQLNLDDSAIAVVNRTWHKYPGLSYQASLFAMDGSSLFKTFAHLNIDSIGAKEIYSLSGVLQKVSGISFLVLELKDMNGKTISNNVYWFEPQHHFEKLRLMTPSEIRVRIIKTEKSNSDIGWTFELSNPSRQLAFFINPQLIQGGEEILPSFWSDNYFSLAPGNKLTVKVTCPMARLGKNQPVLRTEGWNLKPQDLILPLK